MTTRDRPRKNCAAQTKPKRASDASGLRRRAEKKLRSRTVTAQPVPGDPKSAADAQRLLHELQVHQIELEMQNADLLECRDRTEALLEKYTDLYDFAPVGFFTLDAQSRILEVNMTGADLLGVARSRFMNRFLSHFVSVPCRASFMAFLERVLSGSGKQVLETTLSKQGGPPSGQA